MEIRFKIKETDIDNRPIYIGEVPDEARGTRLVYTEKSNPETVVCKDELEAYFYVTKNMNNFLSLVQYDNKILEVEGIMPEHENNIKAKLLNKAVHKVNTEITPPH